MADYQMPYLSSPPRSDGNRQRIWRKITLYGCTV